ILYVDDAEIVAQPVLLQLRDQRVFVEGNEDPGERIAPRGVEIEQNAKPENGGNEGERHFLALLMAVAEKILDCGHHAVPGAAGMYGPGECPATTEAP